MLVGGGPWLGVLGGVFTDKVIVQRLTDFMWYAHSTTEEDPRVYRLARVLVALRRSIHELEIFYKDISDPKNPPLMPGHTHPRFYPYPTSFTENGKTVHFKYTRILEEDATCVAFQAKISDPVEDDSPDIVVKFVTRYGTDVHKFLASEDHAPRLRYYGPLSGINEEQSPKSLSSQQSPVLSLGPMQMVVMDYVTHRDVSSPDAVQQIEAVLYKLHYRGYVFGDLRAQNVLFDEDGKVKFIDFDWSGRYDMNVRDESLPADLQSRIDDEKKHVKSVDHYVCYPLNLSSNIHWAPDARDLEPIRPGHDWFMFNKFLL
jgi:serine/threonine protein kinase